MAGAIIGAGIGAAGQLFGGKAQADAMRDSAKMQSESAQRALDFTKQQYGDLQQRLNPYVQSGQTANSAMAALLARSPYMQALRPPMVTLRAPDGSTKAVPQAQAQQFIARGAQPVA